jgi:hypothetical protein
MGREDDLGRTSKTLFLASRASRGLRVRSAPFVYWTDISGPRVRRTVGALDADPEGAGGGVAEDSTPVRYQRPVGLTEVRVGAVVTTRSTLLGPTGRESLLLGYKDIQGGFEATLVVESSTSEVDGKGLCNKAWQNTARIDRTVRKVLISRDFVRAVLSRGIHRQWIVTDRSHKYRPRIDRQRSPQFAGLSSSARCPRSVRSIH